MKRSNALRMVPAVLAILMMPGMMRAAPVRRSPHLRMEIKARHIFYKPISEPGTLQVEDGSIAVDTHVHTEYSPDANDPVADVLRQAFRRGLAGIAITDHNTMAGFHRAREILSDWKERGLAPEAFFLIPGEEVSSTQGHIVGLYISVPIPAGLSAEETVARIHKQRGLAIAAHPMFSKSLGPLADSLKFDAVETVNAAEEAEYLMAKPPALERRAALYAAFRGTRLGVSDAHEARFVGVAYTLLPNCAPTPEAVRAAIEAGNTVPSEAPRFIARTRHLENKVSHLTWVAADVPTGRWKTVPMMRVPLRKGAIIVNADNGLGVLYRRRF